MEKKKTFLNFYLPNILFNLFETAVIICMGFVFRVKLEYIACIFIAFILNKVFWGKSMHYKDWYICLFWSTLLFISFYLLSYISIEIACISTCCFIFCSERANIKELNNLFMWKKEVPSKYADIEKYIKTNEDSEELIEFENRLKKQDNQLYLIYKYRFKDGLSFSEISANLDDYPTQRLTEKLDAIALSIRIFKEM